MTNPAELQRFASTEYSKVIAAIGRITGDRAGASDALHEAILRYLDRPPSTEPDNLAAWFTVVATNRARDERRRRLAEERALHRIGLPDDEADWEADLGVDVLAAVSRLPASQRRACALYYLADHPISSVASAMGLTEGTVKTHLHRARAALAAELVPDALV